MRRVRRAEARHFTTYVVDFGILHGYGVGFGYSAMTPRGGEMVHTRRTGLMAGHRRWPG